MKGYQELPFNCTVEAFPSFPISVVPFLCCKLYGCGIFYSWFCTTFSSIPIERYLLLVNHFMASQNTIFFTKVWAVFAFLDNMWKALILGTPTTVLDVFLWLAE